MGSNYTSSKICVSGIKWSEGSKDWFLQLDRRNFKGFYGCLYIGKLGEGYTYYKPATAKQLLAIVQGLIYNPGNYSKGEVWI